MEQDTREFITGMLVIDTKARPTARDVTLYSVTKGDGLRSHDNTVKYNSRLSPSYSIRYTNIETR
jgi:hypothetical protein